jgi:glycosyltransferase involved in cell wall biosynthesis
MTRASLKDLTAVIVCDFGHVNGGAAQVAILSALGLIERNVSTQFVYALGPLDARLSDAKIARHVPLDDVWSLRNPLKAAVNGVWNASASRQFGDFLNDLDRDRTIVHFHQWTKTFSPSVIDVALRRGFRTAVSLHDYFLACPNGAYYDYRKERPCTLRPLSPACIATNCDRRNYAHKLVRTSRSAVQRLMLSRQAEMLSAIHVSETARDIIEGFLPPNTRQFILANPVSMDRLERASAETNDAYLFVGRLVPEKGCVAFAKAARRAGVPAVFAGTGPCDAAIREANPDARLLGWLPHAEIVATIRAARALVFPSKWHETSGLVCGEALANGIPVLASSRTAATELIVRGVNGDVFDPDDEAQLTALLSQLQDPSVVSRMSDASYRNYWAAPPTLSAHVDSLMGIYAEIIGRVDP